MEIALLFLAALALIIGYQFYQKHKAFWSKEEAVIDLKEEVVAEVNAEVVVEEVVVEEVVVEEVAVEEVEKAATPKVKAAKKKVAEVEEKIETAVKKTSKKPKIKIAK